MPMDYDRELHGPLHHPMPFVGVWLPEHDRPEREAYWRLQDAQLHATSYQRPTEVAVYEHFHTDRGTEIVWLDVADPAGQQRLFRLDGDGRMSPLDHWRQR